MVSISSRLLTRPPDEAPGVLFSSERRKTGPIASSDPRIRSDMGFHPSDEPMSSPPQGALGESGGNKNAGNVDESSHAPGDPDLSGRKADRRRHHIVFRALYKSAARSFHAM
jgi:hypothetical protein